MCFFSFQYCITTTILSFATSPFPPDSDMPFQVPFEIDRSVGLQLALPPKYSNHLTDPLIGDSTHLYSHLRALPCARSFEARAMISCSCQRTKCTPRHHIFRVTSIVRPRLSMAEGLGETWRKTKVGINPTRQRFKVLVELCFSDIKIDSARSAPGVIIQRHR